MKRIIFAAFCSITALFAASCGRTISDSQTFKPNMGPTISDVTFTLPDGITAATLGNSMVVRITVTASDPEGKEIRYSFSSEAGAVGNIVNSGTGCTAELYMTSVRSGAEVRLTVTAKDVKGAVETRKDILIGSGRKGANVIIDTAPAVAIMPTKDTSFTFHSDINGYYQIVCQSTEPTTTDESLPIYMYTASTSATPKEITANVAGFSSTSTAKVRLSAAADGAYRVWLVFWDDFRQYTFKDMTIMQDSSAPATAVFSPADSSTGIDTATPGIYVRFNEPVSLDTSSLLSMPVTVKDASNIAVNGKLSVSADGYRIEFTPDAALKNLTPYTIALSSGPLTAAIRDRAGNEFSASGNATFTTIKAGDLAKPVFTYDKSTFEFTDTDNQVTMSGPENAAIHYEIAYGSGVPATPGSNSALYSGGPIAITKNTTIMAVALRDGYDPSEIASVTLKRKTRTPEESEITRTNGTPYPSNDAIFCSSSAITFKKSTGTAYYLSSTTSDGTNPAEPSDPSTSDTTPPSLSADNQRLVFKMRIKDADMELSDSYTSPVYRRRDLVRPAETAVVPASGYATSLSGAALIGPEWTSIASSENGRYLFAAANNTGTYNKGGLLTSDDYGVTWTDHSAHSAFASTARNWNRVVSSESGQHLAATDITYGGAGDIWVSSNYGTDWTKRTPASGQGSWLISMSDSGKLFAVKKGTNTPYYLETAASAWNTMTAAAYPIRNILIAPSGAGFYALMVDSDNILWRGFHGVSAWTYTIRSSMTSAKHFVCSDDAALFAATGTVANDTANYAWISDFSAIGSSAGQSSGMGTAPWSGLAMADDGFYLAATDADITSSKKGSIRRNTKHGDFSAWSSDTFRSFQAFWTGIASNADGSLLAAAAHGGSIWCGFGTVIDQDTEDEAWTWTWYNQNMRSWTAIDCSADGQIIVACDGGYGHGGYLFTSTNGGGTFTLRKDLGLKQWRSVSVSEDGTFAAAITDADCFLSVDSGATWAGKTPAHAGTIHFTKVAVSNPAVSTPARAVILSDSSFRFFIDSSGNTVTGNGSNSGSGTFLFTEVVISADGKSFIMIAPDKITKVNSNGGLSDTSYPLPSFSYGSNFWAGIAANSDLSIVYIARYNSASSGYFIDKGFGACTYGINATAISGAHLTSFITSNDGRILNLSNGISHIYSSIDSGSTWIPQTTVGSSNWNCLAATSDGLTVFAGAAGAQNITLLK